MTLPLLFDLNGPPRDSYCLGWEVSTQWGGDGFEETTFSLGVKRTCDVHLNPKSQLALS